MIKYFIILFSLFAFLGTCQSSTFAELITATRLLARDPSSTGRSRFSDTQIKEFINEAQRDAISDTTCIFKSAEIELVADTQSYALPTDFIASQRVTLDYRVLDEISKKGKDQDNSEWETVQGTPKDYYVNFSNRTYIYFYPYPESASDIGTIRLDYYAQATDMTLDADVPYNSISEFTPFHKMLSYYAAHLMAQIDGNMGLSNVFYSLYSKDKTRFYEYCRKRPAYQPGLNIKKTSY